jgi:predicted kinase
MLERVLIILRGIPGCGKSTFAEFLSSDSGGQNICTADDFHMKDGKYDWKPENVRAAHEWCQSKARTFMRIGVSPVIVANTSTTINEMQVYFDMAKEYGYTVFSVIVENRHGGVNTHNVPEETIEKMKNRFDVKL